MKKVRRKCKDGPMVSMSAYERWCDLPVCRQSNPSDLHTRSHDGSDLLLHSRRWCDFVGDTLFAMGCGKHFEGAPQMIWESFHALPAEVRNLMRLGLASPSLREAPCAKPQRGCFKGRRVGTSGYLIIRIKVVKTYDVYSKRSVGR